ncbi:MAG: fibronectin type III domain-containing protein, partial [Thermoplasmata archaeon]|nr:fibronectin type III domain-containing protein [Thermoplasmata archaeon]
MTSLPVGPYRWLLACAVLIVFTASALILTTDDASAWTTADLQPAEKEYRSAFVYTLTSEYYRGEYVFPSYTSIPVQSGYGGYMSYPVSHLDDRTHIESASISIIARNSGSVTLNVKVMDREFHELDPEIALNSIWKATSAGTVTISTGLAYRTYTVSITGAALEDIRDVIAGDDEYLVIAFDLSSLGWVDIFARYIDISGTYYSTLNLEYDDEAPEDPSADLMETHVTGDHIPVSWSASDDNPSGGNRGDISYQVGVYLPDAPADNPYYTSPWLDITSWNLTGIDDNATYTFRVRARDGSTFTSNWSTPVNTTVDNSPPTTPLLSPEPPYTKGSENTIIWWPSIDSGVGLEVYEYQYSLDPEFIDEVYYNSTFPRETIEYLMDITYYYRVRAKDEFGHTSPWSPIERSYQDSAPPSVPIPLEEPEFTEGTSNAFSWHSSYDIGIGSVIYLYEVASSATFSPETIVAT